MNRRSLLRSLAGLATAPLIVTGILKAKPKIVDDFYRSKPMYIYVRSQSNARAGDIANWVDSDNYVVTTSEENWFKSSAGTYISDVPAGSYAFIKIAG